ncbi:MAG: hypothetical protein GWN62_10485 [Aliifodinibius sp.]|nr:hypothetical protein [Fodinibius sp.]
MKICNHYYLAKNVEDAVVNLAESKGSAKVIAGGTDLLLDIQQSRHPQPDTLIDVSQIPEMMELEIRDKHLFIGASVPHNCITENETVIKNAQALTEACGLIGGAQVRNVATLGGNVAHALPAADGTIALMALDASVEIASPGGRKCSPLVDIFLGPGQNSLARDELITGFYLPLRKGGQASSFMRVMRPQGVAIAILNCAVWLEREEGVIQDIRISIGPSGPVPRRMALAEDSLRGSEPTSKNILMVIDKVLEEANFRTSRYRSTQQYRKKVVGVLIKDCVESAWNRAGSEDINNGK